ncbi:hypothetical protein [Yinghuangia sp. YIM S09857]|uniref:hypothetical protein n=1 Tax=Yinghuangia sp. YIM S09857 TaxID=3436929 RepID=UPI003F5389EA
MITTRRGPGGTAMQLEQLIWGLTALGALAVGASGALLAFGRDRVRESGVALAILLTGLFFCTGGFLLSTPRYAATTLIAGGAALVGVIVGLAWSRGGGDRNPRPQNRRGQPARPRTRRR